MSARVMLVNPPPRRRVDQYDMPDFGRLGLACLAGEARSSGIGSLSIFDAKLHRASYHDVLEAVRAFQPDVVGLTAMTNEILPAARVADLLKRYLPRVVTVIGGTHVTVLPKQTLREFPELDHGVIGEGEVTFTKLLDVLSRGRSAKDVAGVVTRHEGKPELSAEREKVFDLDSLADPAWDLLPSTRRYLVSTQRGCPFHCPFCVNPNGRRVRRRSVERVVEELKEITGRHRGKRVYFCDEVFTFDMDRTHRLLDAILREGLQRRLRWTAATHVGSVDRDLLAKMKAAGCSLLEFGIETGDETTMKGLGKGLTIEKVWDARRMASDVGLSFGALMILGHPHENRESARKTIELAVELCPEQTIFGIMVPFPGTAIAKMARNGEGGYRPIAGTWDDYGKQHGHALELESLSRREMECLHLSGYVEVLARNGRYRELARFVWTYRREGMSILEKMVLGGLFRRE